MQSFNRELLLLQTGYTSALQDIYSEIMQCTKAKNLNTNLDSAKTLHAIESGISKAFLNINKKFEEQTTLLLINTNQHGR